jgi:hypothetical protein
MYNESNIVFTVDPFLPQSINQSINQSQWLLVDFIFKDCRHSNSIVWFDWFVMFNVTFNNISFISWRLVLLVKETEKPGKNHRPVASH